MGNAEQQPTYHGVIFFQDGRMVALQAGMSQAAAEVAAEGVARLIEEGNAKKMASRNGKPGPAIESTGAVLD